MISIYNVHRFYILRAIRPKPSMFLQCLHFVRKIPTYEHGWNVSPRSTCPFLTQKHNTTNRKSACRRTTAMSEQCRLVGSSRHFGPWSSIRACVMMFDWTVSTYDFYVHMYTLPVLYKRIYTRTYACIPMIYTQTATCGKIAHTNVTSDRVKKWSCKLPTPPLCDFRGHRRYRFWCRSLPDRLCWHCSV